MTDPRTEYDAGQPECIECSHKAEWQICDEMPVDNDTFSCTEHVSEMISDTTNIIAPYDGDEECLYCYDAPPDLSAIEALLAAPEPWDQERLRFEALCDLYGCDLRALVDEVKRLRHDDAIWDKHSLVQIVTERDRLRSEVKRLQSLLETDQRALIAAEQDKQHWQEKAERLRKELDVTNILLDRRNQVLDAIPECPAHGSQCVPHALEWIEEQVAQFTEALEIATGTRGMEENDRK